MDRARWLAVSDARLTRVLEARQGGEGWSLHRGSGWVSPGWLGAEEKRWSELGARLPARASDAFEVGISRFASTTLRLSPRDASPVEGTGDGGHVVYRNAYAAADLLVTVTRTSMEQLFLLREARERFSFEWDVSVPSGLSVRNVAPEGDGALAIVDATGASVMTVPPAYAVDARGQKRAAKLSWNPAEHRLALSLDASGLQFPVLLDPAFETGAWQSVSPSASPPARSMHAMAYDSVRGNVVLFGGEAPALLGDTWTWNGTTWTKLSPAKSPSARARHAMAFDATRGQVVLFGGYDATAGALDDTWTFDGATWTKLSPASSPPPRRSFAMAYDAARTNVVLFGGSSGAASLDDTWLWSGSTWTKATVAPAPPARYVHSATYDADRAQVVVFGGSNVTDFGDTWLWNGTAWSMATPAKAPSVRVLQASAYDATRRKIVMFGGGAQGVAVFNETWTWDGATWDNTSPGTSPSLRWGHAMAYDALRRRSVVFGGVLANVPTPMGDTWLYYTRGGACVSGAECGSGNCVDGVCCETAACGPCQACDAETPGTCSPVKAAVDPDSCNGAQICDAAGACKLALGQPCKLGSECSSNSCVDGVCCSAVACGACSSCAAALKESGPDGTCGPVRSGADPHDDCRDEGSASCGHDGQCDGAGVCRLYAKGSSCGASACAGRRATGQLCDGFGLCTSTPEGIDCAPYVCDQAKAACAQSCSRDDECVVDHRCDLSSKKCVVGTSCDGNHTVTSASGATTNCAPYRCDLSGCRAECRGAQDCVLPAVCDQSGRCVSAAASPSDGRGDGGGCAIASAHAASSSAGGDGWLIALIASLSWVGRRRSRGRDERGAMR